MVKWLGCAGTDIPVQIAVRDERLKDVQQSVLKLWSGNLFEGTIFGEFFCDITLSAQDTRVPEALTLSVQAFVDMKEGSKALPYDDLQDNEP